MAVSKQCKRLLCLLYAVFLVVSGVLLIIYSTYLGYKLVYYFKFIPSECIAPFILIFLFALGHIILTLLGIKGLRNEYLPHILLFMAITLVFLLSEIAVAIWAMVLIGKLDEGSMELMKSSFEEFVKSSFKYDKLDWVHLQSQFECCGINHVLDYTVLGAIPFSCCLASPGTPCDKINQNGCRNYLVKYTKKLLLYLGLTGFGSALFLILGLFAFYFFYKAVKQQAAEDAKRRASILQEINPLNRPQSNNAKANLPQKQIPSKS